MAEVPFQCHYLVPVRRGGTAIELRPSETFILDDTTETSLGGTNVAIAVTYVSEDEINVSCTSYVAMESCFRPFDPSTRTSLY